LTAGPAIANDDLFRRVLGYPRQAGEPADREQRDVRRGDAVTAGGEGVAELVQDDAGEDGNNEEDAVERRRRAALKILSDADPGEQDQEREMDADFTAGDAPDGDRPRHAALPFGLAARRSS